MEISIAENLTAAVMERLGGLAINKTEREDFSEKIAEVLTLGYTPRSKEFMKSLPDEGQLIVTGPKAYHYFNLEKILSNRNAREYQLTHAENILVALGYMLGANQSDFVVRNLRMNRMAMRTLSECEQPFSLLGRIKTCNHDNAYDVLYSMTKPILIVPGANAEAISQWENKNAVYEEEGDFSGFQRL